MATTDIDDDKIFLKNWELNVIRSINTINMCEPLLFPNCVAK